MPLLTLPEGSQPLSVRAKAMVFEDPKSEVLLGEIRRIAPSRATVLIVGDTGTGKELVARHIHELSGRTGPFLAVNCGALSENLVESELFGHEKGAFTGATSSKAGWFESAHGGTLFLDEIGDLSLGLQVKLLRVLQESEVVRLGSRHARSIDVRLVAATNVNLGRAVAAGRFREDLFYRVNVATLALPALRDRPGDILPLARHFLEVYRQRLELGALTLSSDAARRLLQHDWPGNIRELENVVHHALLVCSGLEIGASDLRLGTLAAYRSASSPPPPREGAAQGAALESVFNELFEQNLPNLHDRVEEALIRAAYRYCDKNQLQTARLLGISRNIVRARLIEHGEIPGTLRGPGGIRKAAAEAESAPASARIARILPRSVPALRAVVRIGYQKLGLLPLLKARGTLERGFAQRGFATEWIEYPGGVQLIDALESNDIALGAVGEGPPIFAQAAHAPMVYLAAEASSPDGEAIIVPRRSRVRTLAELKGKTIALHRGANAHYLVIRACEEAGLSYQDVNLRFLPPDGARVAFERGEVDAWAIWDPMLAEMEHTGRVRVLRTGRGLAANPTYYIARSDYADAHPEVTEVFLAELAATALWSKESVNEAARLLAPKLGMARCALERVFEREPGARLLDAELIASQQQVADAFYRLNLIPEPVTVSEAWWSQGSRPHDVRRIHRRVSS